MHSLLPSTSLSLTRAHGCITVRRHAGFLSFNTGKPVQHEPRTEDIAACFPPFPSFIHKGSVPSGPEGFEERRHAMERHLRSLQPERLLYDRPLRNADSLLRAHYMAVYKTFDPEVETFVQTKWDTHKQVLDKRMNMKKTEDDRKKLYDKFYPLIGGIDFYNEEQKGFNLMTNPYYLPYHASPSMKESYRPPPKEVDQKALAEGALAAYEHINCNVIPTQNWTELSQFITDETKVAEIQTAVEGLSEGQNELLQLQPDDLLYWWVAGPQAVPILGQETAEPHRKVRIMQYDDTDDMQSYTALMVACYKRHLIHSNLIAAVCDTQAYGYDIPRFVFVNLRFEKPKQESEWDLTDLNYMVTP